MNMQQNFYGTDAEWTVPCNEETVGMYTASFKHKISVPQKDIVYVPQQMREAFQQGHARQLILCQHNKWCQRGTECKFIHASTTNMVKSNPGHVNYAWSMLRKCTYERLPAGQEHTVNYPIDLLRGDRLPFPSKKVGSEYFLKTKVTARLERRQRPALCAHFLVNRVCEQGSECKFAHLVHMDENAKPLQLAPRPERGPTKDCRETLPLSETQQPEQYPHPVKVPQSTPSSGLPAPVYPLTSIDSLSSSTGTITVTPPVELPPTVTSPPYNQSIDGSTSFKQSSHNVSRIWLQQLIDTPRGPNDRTDGKDQGSSSDSNRDVEHDSEEAGVDPYRFTEGWSELTVTKVGCVWEDVATGTRDGFPLPRYDHVFQGF